MDTIFAQKLSLNSLGQGCLGHDVNLCRLSNLCLLLGSQAAVQPQHPGMLHMCLHRACIGPECWAALQELVELRARQELSQDRFSSGLGLPGVGI